MRAWVDRELLPSFPASAQEDLREFAALAQPSDNGEPGVSLADVTAVARRSQVRVDLVQSSLTLSAHQTEPSSSQALMPAGHMARHYIIYTYATHSHRVSRPSWLMNAGVHPGRPSEATC